MTEPISGAARRRRREIAWALGRRLSPAIMGTVADRAREIVGRFPAPEQELVAADWPIGAHVVAACLPEAIEVVLDALADGFSPWLLEQVADRCTDLPTNMPSSSASGSGA